MVSFDEVSRRELDSREVSRSGEHSTVEGVPLRVSGLDGLRAVAALGVLAYHFVVWESGLWFGGQPFRETLAGTGAAFGIFGVDIFFLISGTVIPIALIGKTPASFVTARITRLFPAYWVAVLAGFGAYRLLGSSRTSVTDMLINLTMMQSSAGVGDVFAAQWTLWAEMRFYIIAVGLCAFGVTPGRLLVVAALWAPMAALCDRSGLSFASEILIAPYSPLFSGGLAVFGLLRWGRRGFAFWLVLAENAVFGAAWTGPARARALASGTGGAFELTSDQASLCIVACFAVVLVAALVRLPNRWGQILTTAARPTYCLYLIHLPLGSLVIVWLSGSLIPAAAVGLAFLASIVAATGMYYMIERPGARLLRTVLSKTPETPESAQPPNPASQCPK